MTDREPSPWVGSWATAPTTITPGPLAGRTVRVITHLSAGGSRIRVRLSHTFGSADLRVLRATVGLRDEGARLAGAAHELRFGGRPSTTVPAGALVVSDPVDLEAGALDDLAVSIALPEDLPDDTVLTGHDPSHQTVYVSKPGDHTGTRELPVERTIEQFVVVTGVEVEAPGAGGIVAFGDSLTEGNLSTLDANERWPDQLARRLVARGGGVFGVVDLGTGGGRLLHDGNGDSGSRRFDRDVLAQPGATHVVVALGVNDLRNSPGRAEEIVDAADLVEGLRQLARRAGAVGLVAYAGTIMPWDRETFNGGHWSERAERVRREVNAWIREQHDFDGVIDFEAIVRDPAHPERLREELDSGDHLHPNDAGYRAMADGIDLSLFDR